jgi:hypothetical protein
MNCMFLTFDTSQLSRSRSNFDDPRNMAFVYSTLDTSQSPKSPLNALVP